MLSTAFRRLVASALLLVAPVSGSLADKLPIIDAHNQSDQHISYDEILDLMDDAGVSRVILSQRGEKRHDELTKFAAKHPDRIIPAVRTKGQNVKQVKQQIRKYRYGAMAEVLMWHRQKSTLRVTGGRGEFKAPPQVVLPPDHPKVRKLLKIARKKKWPFIPHIEFGSAGADRDPFMAKLEDLLRQHPNHPFALMNMGMLPYEEIKRLIEAHPNVYFLTAGSDPISVRKSDNPFTKMFDGIWLEDRWKDLMIRHPDRLILAIDSVWDDNWRKNYVEQIEMWREALRRLPHDVAHAFAHGNAERLWRLPSAR